MTVKDDPPRWRDAPGDPRALNARAAELVAAVREAAPLGPEALARIERAVLSGRSPRPGRSPLGLRLALLSTLLVASAATAKGALVLWQRHVRSVEDGLQLTPSPPPPRPVHRASAPRALPAPAPVPRPAAAHPRRRALVAPPEPRVVEEAAPPPATEAQLLARVLSRLRQAHDPAGAVVLLDQYARAFPHGVLEAEASSARLEAALALDDRRTALALLDGRMTFTGRLGTQQLLTRAELRASAGRYGEALADFDRVLAPPGPGAPAELERGLYGRAVCLGHLGRDARARADLAAYQQRFPGGEHAAEVARLLAESAPERRP
jgi:hypothetical protein